MLYVLKLVGLVGVFSPAFHPFFYLLFFDRAAVEELLWWPSMIAYLDREQNPGTAKTIKRVEVGYLITSLSGTLQQVCTLTDGSLTNLAINLGHHTGNG